MSTIPPNNPGHESLRTDYENAKDVKEHAALLVSFCDINAQSLIGDQRICDQADTGDLNQALTCLQAAAERLRRVVGRPISNPPRP